MINKFLSDHTIINTMKRLSEKEIRETLKILESTYGGMNTALTFKTPYQLLVSTMMAAQSTDVQVNKVTEKLFADRPEACDIARMKQEELEEYIKTVGLYRSKAKNVLATSRIIAGKYDGDIPRTREEMMELPGVGRKTANVVLSIVNKMPAIAVDTHVFRVSNRIGLANAKDVLKTEEQLMEVIPEEKWADAHHWLIWHGRKICKARRPLCEECGLRQYCVYFNNN